jgi:hypothetical protein
MKLIEALRGVSTLKHKQDSIIDKLRDNACLLSTVSPEYGDEQKKMILQWLEDVRVLGQEISSLAIRIQKTNLITMLTIEVKGIEKTRSLAEWILRRRTLRVVELRAWSQLDPRKLVETDTVKVIRYYDPQVRDQAVDRLMDEGPIIDAQIELVNGQTELIDDEV